MSALFRAARTAKLGGIREKRSFAQLLQNFTQNCAQLQPSFSHLTNRAMLLMAIVLLVDSWIFRGWLTHTNFGQHTIAFTTSVDSELGVPGAFADGNLTTVVIDPDMLMAAIAFGAGLVATIMATALFTTDCTMRVAAVIHRKRVHRNLSRLLGTR